MHPGNASVTCRVMLNALRHITRGSSSSSSSSISSSLRNHLLTKSHVHFRLYFLQDDSIACYRALY